MDFMKSFLLGFLILGLCNSGFTKQVTSNDDYENQNDDDYQYDDEDENKSGPDKSTNKEDNNINGPPFFDTAEYTKTVKIADTIVLECNVRNLAVSNVVMWYNQTTLLFQSQFPIKKDDRLSVDKNHSLKIMQVAPSDDSQYYCTILPNNVSMKAVLHVQTNPTANIYSDGRDISDRSITFRQGDRIEVECKGSGRPAPSIKWFSNGERVGSGSYDIHVNGGKMIIDHADHHHVRLFQCLADNGISVAHATVNINVQYSPKVSAHRHFVNTKEGDNAELHCNWKSFSAGNVVWRKDKQLINVNDQNKFALFNDSKNDNHNSSILMVKNVEKSDIGEYECDVQNNIGKGHTKIHLVYEPEPPRFENTEIIGETVITHWLIRSMYPLTEVMLNYQKSGSKNWISDKPIQHEKSKEHSGLWKIQNKLHLKPGSWHTRVRAKNIEGWSLYSDQQTIVIHPTQYDGFEHQKFEDMTEKNTSGASSMYHISSFICLILLLAATALRRI